MFKKFWKTAFVFMLAGIVLAGCGTADKPEKSDGDKVKIVATFSIIHDLIKEVGGDLVEVHSMVPIGTDPHEYEPLPEDIKKAVEADALFYNGLNLEGGEKGWFLGKLVPSVNKEMEDVYEVMKDVQPMYLTSEDGKDEEVNPHAFLSPLVGIQMTQNIMDALMEIDPEHADVYKENGEKLLEKLKEMDTVYKEKIAEIPEENRILVTSERAYQYMASDYGLKEGYIWAIDTEENGTPAQIKNLVEFINENHVEALFVETNVDKRPMETVARETGVDIVAEIYSDELGKAGSDGGTYIDFLQSNIEKIHQGLTK